MEQITEMTSAFFSKELSCGVLCDKNGAVREILDDEKLIIGCGSGSIELIEVQLEGAKRMSAEDFMRGQRITEGTVFGE